jgi:tetratricopeptide (TPR) repeat protein
MNWVKVGVLGLAAVVLQGQQPETASDLNQRGLAAEAHGKHADAEKFYREAVGMWRDLGPEFEAHLATTNLNLAQSLCSQGKRREGAKVFEEALTLLRKSVGLEHYNTLTALNLLGGTYLMLGDVPSAMALFEEALPVLRESYPDDVQLSRTLGGLAAVRLHEDKPDEALPLAEEALRLALKSAGENSIDAALAYGNIAEIHRNARRPERALPLYRKARSIYERQVGPSHIRVASLLGQEGIILLGEGKLTLAEQNLERSLDMVRTRCPECVLERFVAETNLAILRFRQGKYEDADRLLSSVLALQEQYWAEPGPDLAATLKFLAIVREKEKMYKDAERLNQRASMILGFR